MQVKIRYPIYNWLKQGDDLPALIFHLALEYSKRIRKAEIRFFFMLLLLICLERMEILQRITQKFFYRSVKKLAWK
jgi:hypothetical protein